MNSYRKTALWAGILYIIGTISGILSVAFTTPIFDETDFLAKIADDENQLVLGALSVLVMGLSLSLLSIVVFPVLKKFNETLAVGYVVFRGALEITTYLFTIISWLLLIPLSREYIDAGMPQESHFQTFGTVLQEASEWIGSISVFIFIIGAVMFYTVLYQSKLVPRWLSGWGLLATLPYVLAGFLAIFSISDSLSTTNVLMNVPLAIQEMALALWLIVRGFNATAFTKLTQ